MALIVDDSVVRIVSVEVTVLVAVGKLVTVSMFVAPTLTVTVLTDVLVLRKNQTLA